MARLKKHPGKLGTRDGITTYELNGRPYMRTKSSLSAERVKSDPVFREFIQNSQLFGKAAKLGSEIFSFLMTKKPRKKPSYRHITGWAYTLLKSGIPEQDILERGKMGEMR